MTEKEMKVRAARDAAPCHWCEARVASWRVNSAESNVFTALLRMWLNRAGHWYHSVKEAWT